MLTERSMTEPERQVRFSALPPSTPLITFDVLEWSPEEDASGRPLARLQAWRASSERRSESHASLGSNEGMAEWRDRTAFGDTLGSWTCFRTLSCCGDRLVLEDAAIIDAGPARRGQFTWQLGPGRLSSTGAHQDWRQVLTAAADPTQARATSTEMVPRDTLTSSISKRSRKRTGTDATPSSKREIQLQDIRSIRRHCFHSALPLIFNAQGREVADGDADIGKRHPRQRKGRHHSSKGAANPAASHADQAGAMRWRYELWGPVGLILTLRGGHRLYLAFASVQHAEQMEELLVDFAAGVGISRRVRSRVLSPRRTSGGTPGGGSFIAVPTFSSGDGVAAPTSPSLTSASAVAGGCMVEVLTQSRRQGSPSVSVHSPRLASRETSFQTAASPPITPRASSYVPSASSFSVPHSMENPAGSSGMVVEVPPTPAYPTCVRPPTVLAPDGLWRVPPPLTLPDASGPPRATTEAVVPSRSPPLQDAHSTRSAPGSGYLYCRPWAEEGRRRRYYVKLSTLPDTQGLLYLTRHRLQFWRRLHEALTHAPRAVYLDLRHTTVTASTNNDRLLQVSSLVTSFAQYRDVEPLGGGVALTGPPNESAAVRSMRRREMEMCTGRPVIFEAHTKSAADRAAWLSWLEDVGAGVVKPAAAPASAAAAATTAATEPAASSPQLVKPLQAFHPLSAGHFVAFSPLLGSPLNDRRESGTPSHFAQTDARANAASEASAPPRLPLQERTEGRLGGSLVSDAAPLSHATPGDEHLIRQRPSCPKSNAASGSPPDNRPWKESSDAEAELSIVVEDDERDGPPVALVHSRPQSPNTLKRSDPSLMNSTIPPTRRSSASPVSGDAARWDLTGGSRLVTRVPPAAKAAAVSAAVSSSPLIERLEHAAPTREPVLMAVTSQKYLDDTSSSSAPSVHSAILELLSPGKETLTTTVPDASPTRPPSATSAQSRSLSTRDQTPRERGSAAMQATAVAKAVPKPPRRRLILTAELERHESPPHKPASPRPSRPPSDVPAAQEPTSWPPGQALIHSRTSDTSEASMRHSSEEAAATIAAMAALVARLSQYEEVEEEEQQCVPSRSASPDAPRESAPPQALRLGSSGEGKSPLMRHRNAARHVAPASTSVHSPVPRSIRGTSSPSPLEALLAGTPQQVAPDGAEDAVSSSVSSVPSPSSDSLHSPHPTAGMDARLQRFFDAAHEQHPPIPIDRVPPNAEAKRNDSGSRGMVASTRASQPASPRGMRIASATTLATQAAAHAQIASSLHNVLPGSPSARDSKHATPRRLPSESAATLSSGGGSYARRVQAMRAAPLLQPSSFYSPERTPSNSGHFSPRSSEVNQSRESSPTWDVVEQRRRAFRESLFIHHKGI